jgi:hypothetical protein
MPVPATARPVSTRVSMASWRYELRIRGVFQRSETPADG